MFTFQGRHFDLEDRVLFNPRSRSSTGDCFQMGEQSFSLDLKEKKIVKYLLRGRLPVILIAVSFKNISFLSLSDR